MDLVGCGVAGAQRPLPSCSARNGKSKRCRALVSPSLVLWDAKKKKKGMSPNLALPRAQPAMLSSCRGCMALRGRDVLCGFRAMPTQERAQCCTLICFIYLINSFLEIANPPSCNKTRGWWWWGGVVGLHFFLPSASLHARRDPCAAVPCGSSLLGTGPQLSLCSAWFG